MRKKILFLISNLESGGVSKSMASLLNAIDRERFDVSLWIASPRGVFMPLIPEDVTLVTDNRIEYLYRGVGGVWPLIKSGHPLLAIGSVIRLALSCINKAWAGRWLARLMPKVGKPDYDLIVDFNGQQQLYYMVNKLHGKRKVTFFHSDYNKWPYYRSADRKYFPKVDAIFTISDSCLNSLKDNFPDEASKMHVMENISSPTLIYRLSEEEFDNPWKNNTPDTLKIVTVGHVSDLKGSHWAIEAASILKKRHLKLHWAFIGSVADGAKYKRMVAEMGVEAEISFLGVISNPYPFIKAADLFVHPSQFEGRSIALDEAKILCKPIVVTNFSTVNDQFTDGLNALICEMTPQSIADSIIELYRNTELRKKYKEHLSEHIIDNSSEVEKLYELI